MDQPPVPSPAAPAAPGLKRSGFWFLLVGGTAAAVHMGVFALVHHAMLAELANALSFCGAFVVSFIGHRSLTFADTRTGVKESLVRFFLTGLAGFASNELVFSLLLRGLGFPPLLALFFAQGFAAGQTFLLGRFWAFKR